jgi:hypothetical protein
MAPPGGWLFPTLLPGVVFQGQMKVTSIYVLRYLLVDITSGSLESSFLMSATFVTLL